MLLLAKTPNPSPADVERIRGNADPVLRNLQITQCYHELSAALAQWTGPAANWCTFATWASRQAGQTIRKEDLERLVERSLRGSATTLQASRQVAAAMNIRGEAGLMGFQSAALGARNFASAVERASDAVGRGNKKVFEEIGREFARFFQDCLSEGVPDPGRLDLFCGSLRPGPPPDGQEYLRRAFRHYAQALEEPGPKLRAELLFLANLEIGLHEQTRLQPEIAESMDAAAVGFFTFTRALFRGIFPLNGWLHLAYLYLMRLLGRPTELDKAIQAFLNEVKLALRRLITELMMTITLPSGEVLRLSEDLKAGFAEPLRQLTLPELVEFLAQHGLAFENTQGTGALDWADLPDRLNFICGLFRCYQERPDLLGAPFTPQQVEALKAGRLPDGRL